MKSARKFARKTARAERVSSAAKKSRWPRTVSGRPPARNIDHLVLPVESLEVARKRLTALGFTVAPDAVHPFGTENACVFLADGAYLEPLAVHQREDCEAAARKGNIFVARDQAYRFRRSENGFSAVAFSTGDAKSDAKAFAKAGLSAGNILKFSRMFEDRKGNKAKGEFALAFAGDLRAPDAFFFTTQRLNVPAIDRTALQRHKNGATGLREVFAGEANPSDFQYWLQEVTGVRDVNAHSFGIEIATPNANVAVYSAAGIEAFYGVKGNVHGRGLRLQGALVAVRNIDKTEALLRQNGVVFVRHGRRLVVPPAPGQGFILAFEAAK